MSKIYCIYHSSDFDGICSAAIVNKHYKCCELIGYNYTEEIINDIDIGSTVVLVDLTLSIEEMQWLDRNTNFIWIDHHKNRIEQIYDIGLINISGLRNTKQEFAACDLTWMYFYPNEEMPDIIKLLGRYDVWDHYTIDVIYLQYGLKNIPDIYNPKSHFWTEQIYNNDYQQYVNDGKIIYTYLKQYIEYIINNTSYTKEIDGYIWQIINVSFDISPFLKDVIDWTKIDVVCSYRIGQYYTGVSLRSNSDNVDVSKIARKYGGNGHVRSAGMKLINFNFLLGKDVTCD
jgi:oligoribonuclease NrnB/cAMP/cGMP phosphodiesterase (DHH superfamily)